MKKNSKKGFVLAETIAISAIVLGALVIIYDQFIDIARNYNSSFKYNNVDKLYAVDSFAKYIMYDGSAESLAKELGNLDYIDVTSCPSEYINEYNYCKELISSLDIKTIFYTDESALTLKNSLLDTYSEGLKKFIRTINSDGNSCNRLIAEFNDNTYATLKMCNK